MRDSPGVIPAASELVWPHGSDNNTGEELSRSSLNRPPLYASFGILLTDKYSNYPDEIPRLNVLYDRQRRTKHLMLERKMIAGLAGLEIFVS